MARASYRALLAMPAWGLYVLGDEGEILVASVRAPTAYEARTVFKQAGLTGDRVRRISD